MLLTDKLVNQYKELAKTKPAPHDWHNFANKMALAITAKTNDVKQANNLWNYIRTVLIQEGFDPYTIKENGFSLVLKTLVGAKI